MKCLLHKGGVMEPGAKEDGGANHGVKQIISFTQKGEASSKNLMEAALILLSNGKLVGFARNRPTRQQQMLQANHDISLLNPLRQDGITALLPATDRLGKCESEFSPSMHKFDHSAKLLVLRCGMISMYGTDHDKLTDEKGLQFDEYSEGFEGQLPKKAKKIMQSVAVHPRDANLYAISCNDGSVIMKNFLLVDKDQLLEKATVARDGTTPIAHMLFTPSGDTFVVCKTIDKSGFGKQPETILETYLVPKQAISPSSREIGGKERYSMPKPKREEYTSEEALDEAMKQWKSNNAREKKKQKEQKDTELSSWIIEQTKENRGERLLSTSALNTIPLGRGHPIAVLPIEPSKDDEEKMKTNKEVKERVLILWKDCIQIYGVANGSLEKKKNLLRSSNLSRMRCALMLKVPQAAIDGAAANANADGSGVGDSAIRRFWLIGTASDELLLLTEDLQHAKIHQPTPRERGVRLAQLLDSQTDEEKPLGIASIAAVGDPDKVTDSPTVPEAAALCVGFDDGSVRQYSIKDLLAAF